MTNQTNEELLEIEDSIEYYAQGYDVGCPYPSVEDIMSHIQSYTNKAISDVLDNLTQEFVPIISNPLTHKAMRTNEVATRFFIPLSAIQKERNKLKEVSNE